MTDLLDLLLAILLLDALCWWFAGWLTGTHSRIKPVLAWPYLLLKWLAHKHKPFI